MACSNNWSDGLGRNFGAVTSMHAASPVAPVVGFVSSANSLVGSHANDFVGNGSFNTLSTGNIILCSPNWNGNADALTFININDGRTGVSSGNDSLIGALPNDFIDSGGIGFMGGDRFLVRSPTASVNGIAGAGRINIELTPGIGDNADAVLLGPGGLADISYSFCNACDSLFGDPLLDPLPDAGIFISGVLQNPAGDAILAMLGRDGGDDSDPDDDDDDEEEETECN